MSSLIKLCHKAEVVEGMPVSVVVDGFPKLAVYRVDEEYFVTDNRCTHGTATLTDGFQDHGTIECPFHGGAFDIRTGAPAAPPCSEPIRTYRVMVEDDYICIPADAGTTRSGAT